MPPVMTSTSRPCALAVIAPISRRSRCTKTSKARVRVGLPGRDAGEHVAQVAVGAGQALEPGPVLEDVRELGAADVAVLEQPQQQAGVDRSRTGWPSPGPPAG